MSRCIYTRVHSTSTIHSPASVRNIQVRDDIDDRRSRALKTFAVRVRTGIRCHIGVRFTRGGIDLVDKIATDDRKRLQSSVGRGRHTPSRRRRRRRRDNGIETAVGRRHKLTILRAVFSLFNLYLSQISFENSCVRRDLLDDGVLIFTASCRPVGRTTPPPLHTIGPAAGTHNNILIHVTRAVDL